MNKLWKIFCTASLAVNIALAIVLIRQTHTIARQKRILDVQAGLVESISQKVDAITEYAITNAPSSFAGIYELPANRSLGTRSVLLDLRSDGTCLVDYGGGGHRSGEWKASGDRLSVPGFGAFTVEGDDLIDSHQYRWIRVR